MSVMCRFSLFAKFCLINVDRAVCVLCSRYVIHVDRDIGAIRGISWYIAVYRGIARYIAVYRCIRYVRYLNSLVMYSLYIRRVFVMYSLYIREA